jgi:hypothetical protein
MNNNVAKALEVTKQTLSKSVLSNMFNSIKDFALPYAILSNNCICQHNAVL